MKTVCLGLGGVSSEGDSGVFDISDEDGGEETENTVLDTTDCDKKVCKVAHAAVEVRWLFFCLLRVVA